MAHPVHRPHPIKTAPQSTRGSQSHEVPHTVGPASKKTLPHPFELDLGDQRSPSLRFHSRILAKPSKSVSFCARGQQKRARDKFPTPTSIDTDADIASRVCIESVLAEQLCRPTKMVSRRCLDHRRRKPEREDRSCVLCSRIGSQGTRCRSWEKSWEGRMNVLMQKRRRDGCG